MGCKIAGIRHDHRQPDFRIFRKLNRHDIHVINDSDLQENKGGQGEKRGIHPVLIE
jgi:hypothetical protein